MIDAQGISSSVSGPALAPRTGLELLDTRPFVNVQED